jgi:hypothetical protein
MRLASLITTILLTTLSASADLICEPGDDSQFTCKQAIRGNGETLYHSNGRVMTYSAGRAGASWYHSNGAVMSHNALSVGASVYYADGSVLSHSAGSVGASWYHDNGRVMSHSMGSRGATWYNENGSVLTHNGPALSSEETYLTINMQVGNKHRLH